MLIMLANYTTLRSDWQGVFHGRLFVTKAERYGSYWFLYLPVMEFILWYQK